MWMWRMGFCFQWICSIGLLRALQNWLAWAPKLAESLRARLACNCARNKEAFLSLDSRGGAKRPFFFFSWPQLHGLTRVYCQHLSIKRLYASTIESKSVNLECLSWSRPFFTIAGRLCLSFFFCFLSSEHSLFTFFFLGVQDIEIGTVWVKRQFHAS